MLIFQLVAADYVLPGSLERAFVFHAAPLLALTLEPNASVETLLPQCMEQLASRGYRVEQDDTTWSVWSSP